MYMQMLGYNYCDFRRRVGAVKMKKKAWHSGVNEVSLCGLADNRVYPGI